MFEILKREFVYIWYYFDLQLRQILPYWVLGIVIGSIISVFGKQKIHSLMTAIQDKHLGVMGIIPASLIGIASPLCMYGTIPIAASFSQKGMRDDYLAAFMMSSVLLNPQLLIYSAALGDFALCIRFISCFLCGIAAGLVVRFCFKDRHFFNFDGFSERKNRDTDPNIFMRLLKNIGSNIKATGLSFFNRGIIVCTVSKICSGRCVCKLVCKQSRIRTSDGGNNRCSAVCLRRRYYSAVAAMAGKRYEYGKRFGVYDNGAGYKNCKFGCIKNCTWSKAFCFIYCICNGIFAFKRFNC